jgi:hypothetical protein
MTLETGFSVQIKCQGMLFEMCRVAASKLFLHYFYILYTDIFKNKFFFQHKCMKKIKKSNFCMTEGFKIFINTEFE